MTETKKPRGLAALSPERRAQIASMGGKACKAENRWYSRNPDAAAAAGAKGAAARVNAMNVKRIAKGLNEAVAMAEGLPGGIDRASTDE